MMNKYPVESDFLDSYLNYFILKSFYANSKIANDADVFKSCVHLNPAFVNLANCSDRRDNVNNFITSNEEGFNKYRNIAIESCKNELLSSHGASLQLEKDLRSVAVSEISFIKLMTQDNEESLRNCINKNL